MSKKFKNSQPAYPSNNWASVQLFLDTWGELPGEQGCQKKLMTLKKEDLARICEYALDAACRIELSDKHVKFIQDELIELGWLNEGQEESK